MSTMKHSRILVYDVYWCSLFLDRNYLLVRDLGHAHGWSAVITNAVSLRHGVKHKTLMFRLFQGSVKLDLM